jgi:methylmalonyl-CoA/ethylmalonyl-CoA epimerase
MLLDGLIIGIDHVGVAAGSIDESGGIWAKLLGVPVAHRETVASQKAEAAFLDLPDRGAAVELVAPTEGNESIARFLEKRGPGLHHLAIAVTDIHAALARLQAAGIPLVDQAPRPGARGHLIAFLHPKATGGTLVELVERRHP